MTLVRSKNNSLILRRDATNIAHIYLLRRWRRKECAPLRWPLGSASAKKSIIFEHVPLLEHEDMPGNDNDELGVESGWLGGRWG